MSEEQNNTTTTENTTGLADGAGTAPKLMPVGETFLGFEKLLPRLPVGERSVREWTRQGIIPSIRLPGSRRVLYHWPSVEAALLRQQRGGNE